jgi:hypothetical protein
MSDPQLTRALAAPLPAVEARLVTRGIARDAAEAASLLDEVKRFLVLSHRTRGGCPMISLRVDAAWHELLLFTEPYAAFCREHLGTFMSHDPTVPDAPPAPAPSDTLAGEHPVAAFAEAYEDLFGAPLPPLWDDATGLHRDDCVQNARHGRLTVGAAGAKSELRLGDAVVARVDAFAAPALRFLAAHRRFHVRELPDLADADRVALCVALLRTGVLERYW